MRQRSGKFCRYEQWTTHQIRLSVVCCRKREHLSRLTHCNCHGNVTDNEKLGRRWVAVVVVKQWQEELPEGRPWSLLTLLDHVISEIRPTGRNVEIHVSETSKGVVWNTESGDKFFVALNQEGIGEIALLGMTGINRYNELRIKVFHLSSDSE
jgi:hypothetical protein